MLCVAVLLWRRPRGVDRLAGRGRLVQARAVRSVPGLARPVARQAAGRRDRSLARRVGGDVSRCSFALGGTGGTARDGARALVPVLAWFAAVAVVGARDRWAATVRPGARASADRAAAVRAIPTRPALADDRARDRRDRGCDLDRPAAVGRLLGVPLRGLGDADAQHVAAVGARRGACGRAPAATFDAVPVRVQTASG